jgi:hypothetical protein
MAAEIKSFDYFVYKACDTLVATIDQHLETLPLEGRRFWVSNYREAGIEPYVINRIGHLFASAMQFLDWVFYGNKGTAYWYPSQENVSWSLFGMSVHTQVYNGQDFSTKEIGHGIRVARCRLFSTKVTYLTLPIFGEIAVSCLHVEGRREYSRERYNELTGKYEANGKNFPELWLSEEFRVRGISG